MSSTPPPRMAPPTEPPAESPKRRASYLGLVVAGGMLFAAFIFMVAVLFPVFAQARRNALSQRCQSRLKRLGAAISVYAADYDGALPSPDKWMDQLSAAQTKSKRVSVFSRPRVLSFACPEVPQLTSYAYNSALAHKKESEIKPDTPLVFDSMLSERNAHSGLETLPIKPRHQTGHNQGNNVVYANGDVRLVRASR